MARNPYLTEASERFLSAIRDSEDGYAIQERGELWVDLVRFNTRTLRRCLLLCLVKEDHGSAGVTIWVLTECGEKVLKDSKFVPLIITALREKRQQAQ